MRAAMPPVTGAVAGGPRQSSEKLYTAQDIDAAYRQGRRTRLGLLGLTTIGSVGGAVALDPVVAGPADSLLLLLVPTAWILLYVLKAGPRRWHMPSPAAVNRQRLRELRIAEKMAVAELRMAEQDRLAHLRLQRPERAEQLANRALGFVSSRLAPAGRDTRSRGGAGDGRGDGSGDGRDDASAP